MTPTSKDQAIELAKAVYARTMAGGLRWSRSAIRGSYLATLTPELTIFLGRSLADGGPRLRLSSTTSDDLLALNAGDAPLAVKTLMEMLLTKLDAMFCEPIGQREQDIAKALEILKGR